MAEPEKDWEKEYNNAFTKKVPFPILKYELCKMNPKIPNLTYTLTTTGIRKETKFELYTQNSTYYELEGIQNELKAKRAEENRIKEEEDKLVDMEAEKKKKEEEEAERIKKEAEMKAANPYYSPPPPPAAVASEIYDVTEKALFELAERRNKQQAEEKKEIEKKKKDEEEKKKSDEKETPAEGEVKEDEEDKKQEVENLNIDYQYFTKINTEDTYGQNIKNCKKILTLWEVTNRGYRKINESYIFEAINNTMEFSGDGRYFVLAVNDYKTFIIYDAQTLARIDKVSLTAKDTNNYDVTYHYSCMLSKDGAYIITGDGYQRYVFNRDGTFKINIPGRNMYTIFMYSPTEFIGIQPTPDYTKSNLIAVDFINNTEKIIFEFDAYISSFNLSPDQSIITYDQWPKINMVNLKGDKKKVELLKEYSSMYRYAFKDDKIALAYSTNYTNMYVALFQNGECKWKHTLKKSYMDIHGFNFTSADKDNDSVMMIENQYTCFQIYRFDENNSTDYTLKTIRNLTFQYPYIAYAVGTKEIWVQDFKNKIKIYYFDGSIAGMENDSNIKVGVESQLKIGLVLDYQNYYQIGEITFDNSYPIMTLHSRRILKDEIPDKKVKAFYRIRMHNQEKKKIEDAVLLHLKDTLVALSLESRQVKHEFSKKVSKPNVVPLRDNSAIFFWEDNGPKIEKMKLPLDPSNPKLFQKVYEANEDMRLVKTTFIEGVEYLYIVDEAKHMKILKNEENRLSIYKDYFVDAYFAQYSDVNGIKQYSYSNEMMYSNNGGYILQEKGKEKEFKFSSLYYSGYSFDYNNTKFPMCSDEFILFALYPEYPPGDYTQQYQSLLLAPPMNSHRIKQRSIEERHSHEFFCPFDDKYIIYFDGNFGYGYGQKIKVCLLNGEVVQEIPLTGFSVMPKPCFSQSGEYMVCAQMISSDQQKQPLVSEYFDTYSNEYRKLEAPTFRVYKIAKAQEYKRMESIKVENGVIQPQAVVENKPDGEDAIISLELIDQFDVPHEFLDKSIYAYNADFIAPIYDLPDDKHVMHVDNKGNVLYINPVKKVLLINNQNNWDSLENYFKKGKLGTWLEIEMFKFGQDYIVIKKQETIYHITYDGKTKKLVHGREIKHKALDNKECDFDFIIPTKLSQFVLFFYKLGECFTIVVWDLEKDVENSNFSSRSKDVFIDYITGKKSKLGLACFNEYIVDLDNGIPNPFMSKKTSAIKNAWCQGMRINSSEDMLLSLGTIVTPLCHKDIYFYKNKSLDNMDIKKMVYYLDKHSVAFDYLDDHEKLTKVLSLFESNPLFYSMLILEDSNHKTPLDYAIENNAAKIIEVILNSLIKLDHFSLSKMIYKKFSILFVNMNLKAFEKYLNTCFFVTQQMASITKVRLEDGDATIREAYSCCILDKEFYKKYEIGGKQDNAVKGEKIKPNAVAPIDKSQSIDKVDVEEEVQNVFEEVENPLKRVSIKGIEFDWIFNTPEGDEFLKNLSETSNINIFGQDIIRDIVLFQWSYFKQAIIYKLLVPYMIYFIIFCLYATWILYEQNLEKDDSGPYHIVAYILGAIILIFNFFWGYVEITQMFFHKMEYIKSFWNMLDLSSVILNSTVVILEFAEADYEDINRVSSISVLILYFKLFYFLRIFSATAYLVRMIIEIVLDMKFFVSVLMIATIAFANSFYILGRNSSAADGNLAGSNVAEAFIFSYKMGLGDFNTDGFGTVDEEILWIIFLLNTLIILIVLLNLVIAIMGDTFDRVQETQENSMLKELTQMIRENEFLFSRKRAFKRAKYIIVIEPEKAEGGGNVSWEGKLNQLKTFIETSSEDHIGHLKKLQDNVENIAATALDDRMRPVEDKINQKLSQCDQRLEKVKKSVETLFKLIGNVKK